MNPPYSNPKPFIEKAWEDSKYCKIVCLVKCDPSTKWWATFWEYGVECPCIQFGVEANDPDICLGCNNKGRYNGPKPGCEVRFFPKRIQFDPPIELVESGDVCPIGVKWCSKCVDEEGGLRPIKNCTECKNKYVHKKWAQKCKNCELTRQIEPNVLEYAQKHATYACTKCKGKGYVPLSGPSFSCALLIFDRRNVA